VANPIPVLDTDLFSRESIRDAPVVDEEPWMTTIGHGPAKLPVRVVKT
jgi:hypothetical protein